MIKRIDTDMVMLFWESAKAPRPAVLRAFDAEGMVSLVPAVDHFTALKSTIQHIVDTYGIKAGGKVDYNGLAHDRNAVGVEARRLIKGAKRNDMPFLFSMGAVRDSVDEDRITVEVLEADVSACPEIAQHLVRIEQEATRHWLDQCEYISANDLTNAITSMIKKCRGFMLRSGGILWHAPEDMIGPYERISAALAPHGVMMMAAYWNPKVNKSLLAHVCNRLEEQSMEVFQNLIEEARSLASRNAKPRSNGQRTRLEELIETEATITHNKSLLGKAFVKLCKAAQAAREAIGAEAIRAFE